jgi:hypothetical protein
MTFGNPEAWASRFRSIDQRLMERVVEVWPQCLSLLPEQPEEDFITANLVNLLSKDAIMRKICYLEYHYAPFGMQPNGAVFGKGYIDFALILDQDRDIYIAYECKRLNVRYKGRRRSLAGPYVNEGMMRYVSEKYSDGLPFAGMIGYILDGDVPFARSQLWNAINVEKDSLCLVEGPNLAERTLIPECFTTLHQRPNGISAIEIRHVLLSFAFE